MFFGSSYGCVLVCNYASVGRAQEAYAGVDLGVGQGGPGPPWATISIEKDIVSSLDLDYIDDKFAATED